MSIVYILYVLFLLTEFKIDFHAELESPLDNPHFHVILNKSQALINQGFAKSYTSVRDLPDVKQNICINRSDCTACTEKVYRLAARLYRAVDTFKWNSIIGYQPSGG